MIGNGDDVKPSAIQTDQNTAEKILKQVEYYFGDINLPRDKFLQEEMKKDDGWIPLVTMLKFNRLASITTDLEVITEALKNSHLIDVSEDNAKIRRSPEVPLPENTLEYWQEIKRRTVYLKGFPQESTLDEIAEFVGQYGDVKNILMRKTRGSKETQKVFKGSVFVTYATPEQAMRLASSKDLKFKEEHQLENKMQEQYWADKHVERQAQRDLKKQKRKEAIVQQNKSHYVKGLVLKLNGLPTGEAAEVDVTKLKEFFKPYGLPAFAVIDGTEATVRFGGNEENAAQIAWQKAVADAKDGKVLIGGSEVSATVLEGEEEAQYWTEFSKAKVAKQQRGQQQKKGKKAQQGKRSQENRRKRGAGQQEQAPGEGKKAKRTVFKDDDDEDEPIDDESSNTGAANKTEENGTSTKVEVPEQSEQTEQVADDH